MLLKPLRAGAKSNPHDIVAIIDDLTGRRGEQLPGVQKVAHPKIKIAQGIRNCRVGSGVPGQFQQRVAITHLPGNSVGWFLLHLGGTLGW